MLVRTGERFMHARDKCLCMPKRDLGTQEINVCTYCRTRDKCVCVPEEVYIHLR